MKHELKNDSQNVFFQLDYHEETKGYVYAIWIGSYITTGEIQQGAQIVLDSLKENNTGLFLNDNRQVEGTWDEANDWLKDVWMPQAVAVGLKKFAHIISQDLFSQLSAEFLEDNSKKVEGGFQLRMFEEIEDAKQWLFEE